MTHDEATKKAMELIPCTCGGYGKEEGRHLTDCPRHGIAWEDIAAALVEASAAPNGHIVTDDGVVRKVLRTVDIGKWPSDAVDRVTDAMEPHGTVLILEAAEAARGEDAD